MSTDWKDGFDKAVRNYFGIPDGVEFRIDEDYDEYMGCPTCGGSGEFTVNVWWYSNEPGPRGGKAKKKYRTKTYSGSLIEFMQNL